MRDAASERHVAGRRWSARDALVAGQVAVTIVLVVIAGLLLRSLAASQAAQVGFRTTGLAVVSADTAMLRYTPDQNRVFWAEAERRLRALPGVEHVAFASRLPFSLNFNRDTIAVPGHQKTPGRNRRADQQRLGLARLLPDAGPHGPRGPRLY